MLLNDNIIVAQAKALCNGFINNDKQKGAGIMRLRALNTVSCESRLMDTEELRAYTNLGRNNAMKLGEEIGAKVKVGKRVLWDRVKLDQYLNELTGV